MSPRLKPADAISSGASGPAAQPGSLTGIRVIEMADEQAEYCGLTLAGLGADVLKVEPPGGSPTRRIGPFYQDKPNPEGSLFFWQYNRGKRSVVLDLDAEPDRVKLRLLLAEADILLESTPKGRLDAVGLGKDILTRRYPTLIHARVSPFGDEGPWSHYKGSDLVHLALGGVMMNCGYPVDGTAEANLGAPPAVAADGTPVPGPALSAEELEQLTADIVAALKTVYDPEIPADIYELGLIYKVDMDCDRNVVIVMTLTAPGCPVAGEMPQWVENAVASVTGVSQVKVTLTFDPPWDKDRMSDDAKLALNMF